MRSIKRIAAVLHLIWCLFVFVAVMIFILPFILIISYISKSKAGHSSAFAFLRLWGWAVSLLGLLPVRSRNRNIYDKKKAYIFVSNHNSYLDSVAVVVSVPLPFKPLGKIEMNRVPIFGMIYRRLVIMIDRKSPESRQQGEAELSNQLKQGQSILIFPEGSMNRSEQPLTEFYDGAFRLAIDTQTPIAPMVILNARKLFPRDKPLDLRPGIISCIFSQPVQVKGLTMDDLPVLKQDVYKIMEKLILQNEGSVLNDDLLTQVGGPGKRR
ncbi:1-acyl-sn-glycerol-3-phosphate acyltransferase [Flavihumibacter sp. R14]|nr:1-acyl-sn-glycerol-3-phosphate acyltransferase [Flavihumibacter soli]